MNVTLHDSAEAYEREYQSVRAAFVAAGTSLQAWLDGEGFNLQLAYRALNGRSFGHRARELRRAALTEAERLRRSA